MNKEGVLDEIFGRIINSPGISRSDLMSEFGFSNYRLSRVLRKISRGAESLVVVDDNDHGIWIVEMNPEYCQGVVWTDLAWGHFRQCPNKAQFQDNKCYEHSEWENPAITALDRKLSYLAGPRNPTPFSVGQLPIHTIEELMRDLFDITPKTRIQKEICSARATLLKSARAFALWKDSLRKRHEQDWEWMDPELGRRHSRSSINPFEYSLKRSFAVLELVPEATKDEVIKAWRNLARKYHPDKQGGDEEAMKEVNFAKDRIFRIRRWDKETKRK